MIRSRLSRRAVLKAGLATAAYAAIGPSNASAQQQRLRVSWWGTASRNKATEEIFDHFEKKYPNITVDGETVGYSEYWPRLATQAAGKNAADVIQQDVRHLAEYARRGALRELDGYVGKQLNLSDFSKDSIDGGRIDNKLYGINTGNNVQAMAYNKTAVEQAGMALPQGRFTWQEFAKFCAEIAKSRKDFYGTSDGGMEEVALEAWLLERGKTLWTADGKLNYDAADMSEWFGMWHDMRQTKACVPADIQALNKDNAESNAITLGKAAFNFGHSHTVISYQSLNKEKLDITPYPTVGAGAKRNAHYLRPAAILCVYQDSKMTEEALSLINFFVTTPEMGRILGVDRGVPSSSAVAKFAAPEGDLLAQRVVRYVAEMTPQVGPLPGSPPLGAGEVQVLQRRINEEVGFGALKPADAGKTYIQEAQAILARSK